MRIVSLLAVLAASPALAQTEAPPPVEIVPPPPKGSPVSVVYDGGTVFRAADGKFELKLGARLQTRWELLRSFADDAETASRFLLPRTRINLDGFAFTKRVRFKMEGGFSDNGNPRLRDFFLDAEIAPGVVVRAGQFKRPFNRQELVSDFATELPEKALTNELSLGGRDLGVMVHNGFDRSPDGIEWAIGIFNGTGDRAVPRATCTVGTTGAVTCAIGTPSNVPADWQPQLVARLGVNLGGIKGYSEADLEGGPLRLAAAVSYRLMNIQDTETAPLSHGFEIDMVLKIAGVSFQAAGFVVKNGDADSQFAGHVQGGAFAIPKKLQLAARFGATPLAVAADGTQDYLLEIRGGPQWYFFGHNLKLSSDVGVLQSTVDESDPELQARLQAQLVF
jgi:hypothetical protein